MMPKMNRLTGRFFTVLISLSAAILLPRAGFAAEPGTPNRAPAARAEVAEAELSPSASTARLLTASLMGGTNLSSPTLCQISDTVYRADGTPAHGTVLVSWQGFTTAAGQAVTPGSLLVTLDAGGGFNASLAPNTGASPAGSYYRALFKLNDGTTETEFWVVPNTQTTTIGAIRSKLVPASQAAQFLTRDYADSNYVNLASTQAITGVKTFSASPAVPTPQNPTDAANKAYVDANAGSGNLASPPPIGSVTPNTVAATTLTATDSITSLFPYMDVRAYGAAGDAVQLGSCAITALSSQLTCNGPFGKGFASSSAGKTIIIRGAGAVNGPYSPLITTIASYVSPTTVNLTAGGGADGYGRYRRLWHRQCGCLLRCHTLYPGNLHGYLRQRASDRTGTLHPWWGVPDDSAAILPLQHDLLWGGSGGHSNPPGYGRKQSPGSQFRGLWNGQHYSRGLHGQCHCWARDMFGGYL